MHVVGGNVLPTQEPARNTEAARLNPLGVIVALDDGGSAVGDLFYDDGDSIGMIIQNFKHFLQFYGQLRD